MYPRNIVMMVAIHMQALPVKRRELLQTLRRLMNMFHKEPGFVRAQLWMNAEDQNNVTLCVEWNTQDDAERYLRHSEYYRILLGAQQLLTASSEIAVDATSPSDGMELIHVIPEDSEDTCEMTVKVKQFWDSLHLKFSNH